MHLKGSFFRSVVSLVAFPSLGPFPQFHSREGPFGSLGFLCLGSFIPFFPSHSSQVKVHEIWVLWFPPFRTLPSFQSIQVRVHVLWVRFCDWFSEFSPVPFF